MKYQEIQNNITKCIKEMKLVESNNIEIRKNVRDFTQVINNSRASEESEIKEGSVHELERLKLENIKYLEKSNADIDDDIISLKENYEAKLKKITPNKYKKYFKDEFNLVASIDEITKKVEATATSILGDRVKSDLFQMLEQYDFEMDIADMELYLEKADKIEASLAKLEKQKSFNILETIENVLQKLTPFRDEEADKNEKSVESYLAGYVIIFVVVTGVIMYYGSLIVFSLCLFVGFLNISRAIRLRSILFNSKILSNNVQNMKNTLAQFTETKCDKAKAKLKDEYDRVLNRLETKRAKNEETIQHVLKETEDNFEFDSTEIKTKWQQFRKIKQKAIDDANETLKNNIEELSRLKKEKQDLEAELDNEIQNLKDSCITYDGKEYVLNSEYIIDFDGNKVITWDFPKESTLFLANDTKVLVEFIQLFIGQTMSKLRAGIATFEVCDTRTAGIDFMPFVKTNNTDPTDTARGACALYISTTEIKELITRLSKELNKRMKVVSKDAKNLDEYNEFMLSPEIKGMCKDYIFLIFINCDIGTLATEELKMLYSIGGRLGIFPLVCTTVDALFDNKGTAVEIVNSIGKVYQVQENGLRSRAKSKILELLDNDN